MKFFKFYLIALISLLSVACSKSYIDEISTDSKITIDQAKVWFSNNQRNLLLAAAKSTSQIVQNRKLDWDNAKQIKSRSNLDLVLVPVNNIDNYSNIISVKNQNGISVTLNAYEHALFSRDSEGNINIILLQNVNFNGNKNSWKTIEEFDGWQFITDWITNVPLKAERWQNGKVIQELFTNQNTIKQAKVECQMVDMGYDVVYFNDRGEATIEHHFSWQFYGCGNGNGNVDVDVDPQDNGGGGSGGNSGSSINYSTMYGPGKRPIAILPNKCEGAAALWNESTSNGTREVFGVITNDNQFLITQRLDQNGGSIDGLVQVGSQLYFYFPMDNNPVPAGTFILQVTRNNVNTDYFAVPIKATVHSHTPCLQDNTNGVSHVPSTGDVNMANLFPMARHWALGCGATGEIIGTNPNDFVNVSTGPISQVCQNW